METISILSMFFRAVFELGAAFVDYHCQLGVHVLNDERFVVGVDTEFAKKCIA